MQPTNTRNPDYYHKVVDCQWGCPAHTNVPEYIRLIADGKYTESYMLNRESNVFPGILGRTCDRPCEPVCRRTRIEDEPVAICRLKRVAADLRGDIDHLLPTAAETKNGKRIALIGSGPASLTVANDLLPLGYECVIFEALPKAGGLMRSNIPSFRLPVGVLEEEIDMILDMGVEIHYDHRIESLKELLDTGGFDSVFVGTGAPKGKELDIPGRQEADANVHIGIDWLESIHFGHIDSVGERVLVIGVGNTAMDCCRSSRRLGGNDIKVMARKSRPYFKASPWELDDAEGEEIEILVNHSPQKFVVEGGRLMGMVFDLVEWEENEKGRLVSKKLGEKFIEADDVILAIGQDNAFPWIEKDIGIEFGDWDMPVVDRATFMTTREGLRRRRRGVGPREHHLGGGARSSSCDLDPPVLPGRVGQRSTPAGYEPRFDQDGPARMALLERLRCESADRDALRGSGSAARRHVRGSGVGLRPKGIGARGRALPQLRYSDRLHGQLVHRVRCVHRRVSDALSHDDPQR